MHRQLTPSKQQADTLARALRAAARRTTDPLLKRWAASLARGEAASSKASKS
jgi:hypothetical protein